MKFIKLKEDHSSGFAKGEILKIPDSSLKPWLASGKADESSEKDFEAQKKEIVDNIESERKKAAKIRIERQKQEESKNKRR